MSTARQIIQPKAVSLQLASFIRQAHWEQFSADTRHEAKRALLNYFAVALAGCPDPTVDTALRIYAQFSAGPAATLIGRPLRLDMPTTAAINAISANVYDFDDTHIPTIIHPTAPVAAALFALSESSSLSGKDFLVALLIGIETQCRIGLAISPFHYDKGWHITSTCGVFGAAAAVGKAIDLSATQLCWALGSAACQAGGLVENLGTMSKSVSVGNAARNGILAALLAQANFNGPAEPLEGAYGFLNVFGESPNLDLVTRHWGDQWEISNLAYKPYPCGVVLNPVLDACLTLSKELDKERVKAIEFITLTGHPLLRQRTDRPGIKTGRESQVSAQHAVPVTLLRGKAGLAEFSDQAVNDPRVRALGSRLRFRDDDLYAIDSAKVALHFNDGGPPLEEYVPVARGALGHPLSDQELEQKLRDLCRHGRTGCDPDRLIAAIWQMEHTDDASSVVRLADGSS